MYLQAVLIPRWWNFNLIRAIFYQLGLQPEWSLVSSGWSFVSSGWPLFSSGWSPVSLISHLLRANQSSHPDDHLVRCPLSGWSLIRNPYEYFVLADRRTANQWQPRPYNSRPRGGNRRLQGTVPNEPRGRHHKPWRNARRGGRQDRWLGGIRCVQKM